jgi:hypothetical protein
MKSQYYILLLVILTISCNTKTSEWQTLNFGSFKLKAPNGWVKFERTGIDSYVGGLTNDQDSLFFDYGWYSPEIGDEDPSKHKFGVDTINGLTAMLAIPLTAGEGFIRMYINVNGSNKFSISGYNIQSTDTILKIYKSIIFKESDTTKNSVLTLDKFKEYPVGTGKTLFKQNCSNCHALNKTIDGPDLKYLMQDRSTEWLYNFFTKRELVANDSIHIKLKNNFNNIECMKFPNLTIENIEAIREYIMTR